MPAAFLAARFAQRPFLTAEWRYLAMLNFRVPPELLLPLVPSGTRLDFWGDETYVSLVAFQFRDTRVLGRAIPGHRNFEELNLRFYVVRDTPEGPRRGVVFIRELAPRWAVCAIANALYNENYRCVPMRSAIQGLVGGSSEQTPGSVEFSPLNVSYAWKAAGRWHSLHMNVQGPAELPGTGSHEEFIAEHYWGYCRQRDGGTVEYEVRHPPWRIWRNPAFQLDCEFAAVYGPLFAPFLAAPPVSAFLADGSAITVSYPRTIVATPPSQQLLSAPLLEKDGAAR